MADSATTLRAALASVEAQILALSTVVPIDYSLDGESVSPSQMLLNLMKMREGLIAAIIQAEGPTELHVVGTT